MITDIFMKTHSQNYVASDIEHRLNCTLCDRTGLSFSTLSVARWCTRSRVCLEGLYWPNSSAGTHKYLSDPRCDPNISRSCISMPQINLEDSLTAMQCLMEWNHTNVPLLLAKAILVYQPHTVSTEKKTQMSVTVCWKHTYKWSDYNLYYIAVTKAHSSRFEDGKYYHGGVLWAYSSVQEGFRWHFIICSGSSAELYQIQAKICLQIWVSEQSNNEICSDAGIARHAISWRHCCYSCIWQEQAQ